MSSATEFGKYITIFVYNATTCLQISNFCFFIHIILSFLNFQVYNFQEDRAKLRINAMVT